MTKQSGKSDLAFFMVLAVVWGCVFFWWHDLEPAGADDLQRTVELASKSPEATTHLQAALKDNPNPNRSQLRSIHKQLDKLVVDQISKAVTGDSPVEVNSTNQSQMADTPTLAWNVVWGAIGTLGVVIFGLWVIFIRGVRPKA